MLTTRNRNSAQQLAYGIRHLRLPAELCWLPEMPMAALDHFRQELHLQMHRATSWGANAVVINARDLHSALGDFLGPKHQPRCCEMMEQEMIEGDVVVTETADADGFEIQYR